MKEDTKALLSSKTVWSGLVAVAAGLAGIWNYQVSMEEQAAIVEGVVGLVTILAGMGGIYGRIKATKEIA